MSASREKKKRQEQLASNQAANNIPEKKSGFKPLYILYIALAVLFVAVFIFVMMYNTGFFATHTAAVTVGEHEVSPAMYNFYHRSLYNNYYNTYASYGMINTSTTPAEQIYDATTGQTWDDFLTGAADQGVGDSLVWAYSLADAAEAEGFELSQASKDEIEASITSLESAAAAYNYSSVDGYLAAAYGRGCDTELYREFMQMQYLASEYAAAKQESFTYTDEELMSYYEENPTDFDSVDYRYYFVSGKAETEEGVEATVEESDAAMAAAGEAAEAMAAATKGDEDAFVGYAYLLANDQELEDGKSYADYAGSDDDDKTTHFPAGSYSTAATLTDTMAEWLFNNERAAGDTAALADDNGYYVVFFNSRNDNDYNTVNVRHILIEPEDYETSGDEAADQLAEEMVWNAAQAEATEILSGFTSGEQTEDNFAALANEHSTDTGSNTNGGLYEGVYKGQMVEEFSDWCFDESRQTGDTGIVTTTYGYHIMYFVGYGDNYRMTLLENAMRVDAYNDWYEEFSADYTVAEQSGMRHTSV